MNMRSSFLLDTRHLVMIVKAFTEVASFPEINWSPYSWFGFFCEAIIAWRLLHWVSNFINPVFIFFARVPFPKNGFCHNITPFTGDYTTQWDGVKENFRQTGTKT
ncbi:hypothetical protein ES703_86409 [subsurface metagenome]